MPFDAAAVRARLAPGDVRALLTTCADDAAPQPLRRHAERLLTVLAEDAAARRTSAHTAASASQPRRYATAGELLAAADRREREHVEAVAAARAALAARAAPDVDHPAWDTFDTSVWGDDVASARRQADDRAALSTVLGAGRVAEDEAMVALLPETGRAVAAGQAADLRRADPAAVAAAALLSRLEAQALR